MDTLFHQIYCDFYISEQVYTGERTPERELDSYEIEFYTTSTNQSVINGIRYPQKSGNVLVAKPGDVRYSMHAFRCYYAHFSCEDRQIVSLLQALPPVFAPRNEEKIRMIFEALVSREQGNNDAGKLYKQANLMSLIALLSLDIATPCEGRYARYAEEVRGACEYMKQNLEQPLSLADIAAKACLSPGFFHKVFKDIMGQTPQAYLNAQRLTQAKQMLKGSNMPISQIAMACGFGSQSYLNYVFKQHTSQTPKAYRDRHQIVI